MSIEIPSGFKRLAKSIKKKVDVKWDYGKQLIHEGDDMVGAWYIEFLRSGSSPMIDLNILHQVNFFVCHQKVILNLSSFKANGPCQIKKYENHNDLFKISSKCITAAKFDRLFQIQPGMLQYTEIEIEANYSILEHEIDFPYPISHFPTPRLARDYENLLSSGYCADVWFNVGSDEIPAHKIILCARVPYFEKMFGSGMKEASKNVINVSSTDSKVKKTIDSKIGVVQTDSKVKKAIGSKIGVLDTDPKVSKTINSKNGVLETDSKVKKAIDSKIVLETDPKVKKTISSKIGVLDTDSKVNEAIDSKISVLDTDSKVKEAIDSKIDVPDTDPKVFKQLLKFIYSGRVTPDLEEFAHKLLPLAHLYDIQAGFQILIKSTWCLLSIQPLCIDLQNLQTHMLTY